MACGYVTAYSAAYAHTAALTQTNLQQFVLLLLLLLAAAAAATAAAVTITAAATHAVTIAAAPPVHTAAPATAMQADCLRLPHVPAAYAHVSEHALPRACRNAAAARRSTAAARTASP
jgi:hypothetical protein